MFVLPECHALFENTETLWLCTRSVTFGSACLATLLISVYACQRIVPIFLSTGWYATNLSMLLLTAMQMGLLVVECFVINSPKILVVAKYCRSLQVAMSCMLYGKLACDMMNRTPLYYQVLAPVVTVTMLLTTIDSIAVVTLQDDIDCHNLSWLASSMAGVILSASFAIPGRIVLNEIKTASRMQQQYLAVMSTAVAELEQSHLQLWTLLVCNVISTTFQLMIDIYVTYGFSGSQSCDSMFFEHGAGLFEQLFRLLISTVGYLLPNGATIYVFYLLPRFQFSTTLDVPDMAMDDSYELLLTKDEPQQPYVATFDRS